jgi:hypothetical protein
MICMEGVAKPGVRFALASHGTKKKGGVGTRGRCDANVWDGGIVCSPLHCMPCNNARAEKALQSAAGGRFVTAAVKAARLCYLRLQAAGMRLG